MQLWCDGQPIGILKDRSEPQGGRRNARLTPLESFAYRHTLPPLPVFTSAIPPRRSATVSSSSFRRRPVRHSSLRYPEFEPPPSPRRLRHVLFVTVGCLSLLLILWLLFAYVRPLFTPHATVTLIPRSQTVQNTLLLSASQAHMRQLSATAPAQSATGKTTGTIPATRASGTLTFLNQTGADVTIQGAIITDKHGVEVSFQGPLLVPATANNASATTIGTAVKAGASGNIPSFDIVMPCCAPDHEIEVENTTAFTGGADARPNDRVEKQDIERLANPLIAAQEQQEQAQLLTQKQSNEQVIAGTLTCSHEVQTDAPVGTQATSVTVTVTVTCTEEVYDQEAVQAQAATLLGAQVPPGYALTGQVTVTVLSMSNASTLHIHALGRWLYHFSQAQLKQFATLIAGQSQMQARTLLRQQTGVLDAHISGTSSLPSADDIQFSIQPGG
jgi:hypothetical protein